MKTIIVYHIGRQAPQSPSPYEEMVGVDSRRVGGRVTQAGKVSVPLRGNGRGRRRINPMQKIAKWILVSVPLRGNGRGRLQP